MRAQQSLTTDLHRSSPWKLIQPFQFYAVHTSANMQNDKGQGVSHANDSALPQKVQEKVRIEVEITRSVRLTKPRSPQASSTRYPTQHTTPTPTRTPARYLMPPGTARYRRCCRRVCQPRWRRLYPMPFTTLVARTSEGAL